MIFVPLSRQASIGHNARPTIIVACRHIGARGRGRCRSGLDLLGLSSGSFGSWRPSRNEFWLPDHHRAFNRRGQVLPLRDQGRPPEHAGYSIDSKIGASLGVPAARSAISQRDIAGALIHSGRESQVRFKAFVRDLEDNRITGSMGHLGACGDNAAMEFSSHSNHALPPSNHGCEVSDAREDQLLLTSDGIAEVARQSVRPMRESGNCGGCCPPRPVDQSFTRCTPPVHRDSAVHPPTLFERHRRGVADVG
ncbi:hypothetical protein ABIB15_001512 [Marisediminicola sp. UYEF4]